MAGVNLAPQTYLTRPGPVASSALMRKVSSIGARVAFGLLIFAVLTAAILMRPAKWLSDFDQAYYLTIVHDLIHHGVFSNGVLDDVDSTVAVPPPGMFFGPLYPLLITGVTKIDARFAQSINCAVEVNHGARPDADCEIYVRPMHVIHGLLLALGVLAIARAGEVIFTRAMVFWLAGALATGALLADADLFSFLMTESMTFSLYGLTMLALAVGWTTAKRRYFVMAGLALGLLCLARFSYLVAVLVIPVLIFLSARFFARPHRWAATSVLMFALAFLAVLLPWAIRNAISVGKFALTEEYGSVTLIERLAFDQMTAREFFLAFPFCIPEIGPRAIQSAFGPDAMTRFQYDAPVSFYRIGAGQRWALVAAHKRIDPIIGELFRAEMKKNWWRYILVSVPLAWCGLWVGGWLGLLIVPLFPAACIAAFRQSKPAFLLYAAPPLVMLGLHAAIANHYTRYNLALIGPFSVGAAWLLLSIGANLRSRWRAVERSALGSGQERGCAASPTSPRKRPLSGRGGIVLTRSTSADWSP